MWRVLVVLGDAWRKVSPECMGWCYATSSGGVHACRSRFGMLRELCASTGMKVMVGRLLRPIVGRLTEGGYSGCAADQQVGHLVLRGGY